MEWLKPASGCTQVGTTPGVAFRTVVGYEGEVETKAAA